MEAANWHPAYRWTSHDGKRKAPPKVSLPPFLRLTLLTFLRRKRWRPIGQHGSPMCTPNSAFCLFLCSSSVSWSKGACFCSTIYCIASPTPAPPNTRHHRILLLSAIIVLLKPSAVALTTLPSFSKRFRVFVILVLSQCILCWWSKRFSIIASFSSQNILYEKLWLRRHKQRHRFALLHPRYRVPLDSDSWNHCSPPQRHPGCFPWRTQWVAMHSHLSKTKLPAHLYFAHTRVLEILINLLDLFYWLAARRAFGYCR